MIVHRRYTEAEYQQLSKEWLQCGARGDVLVSASIPPKEKAVMHQAMEAGYRIIYLRENGFSQYYKPAGRSFDACMAGRLLQISSWKHHTQHLTITRERCLWLNDLAINLVEKG